MPRENQGRWYYAVASSSGGIIGKAGRRLLAGEINFRRRASGSPGCWCNDRRRQGLVGWQRELGATLRLWRLKRNTRSTAGQAETRVVEKAVNKKQTVNTTCEADELRQDKRQTRRSERRTSKNERKGRNESCLPRQAAPERSEEGESKRLKVVVRRLRRDEQEKLSQAKRRVRSGR